MSGVWYNVRRNVHEALLHMDARHRYVAQVVQLQLDLPLLTIEEFVAGDEQLRTLSDFFAADSILTRLFFFRASAVAQPQSAVFVVSFGVPIKFTQYRKDIVSCSSAWRLRYLPLDPPGLVLIN